MQKLLNNSHNYRRGDERGERNRRGGEVGNKTHNYKRGDGKMKGTGKGRGGRGRGRRRNNMYIM